MIFLDELADFEEAWDGNARKYLPGWTGSFRGHNNIGKIVFMAWNVIFVLSASVGHTLHCLCSCGIECHFLYQICKSLTRSQSSNLFGQLTCDTEVKEEHFSVFQKDQRRLDLLIA